MTSIKTPPTPNDHAPNWPARTIAIAVTGVAALAFAVFALLTWLNGPDAVDQPTTPGAPPVAVPDGEMFAFIRQVRPGIIVVDPALLLTGEAARAAAEADGIIGPGEDLPNDFYISNTDDEELTFGITEDADLIVLTFAADGEITETSIALVDLEAAFTGEYPGVAIYGLVAGEFPVTLMVEGGTVTGFTQVYLP